MSKNMSIYTDIYIHHIYSYKRIHKYVNTPIYNFSLQSICLVWVEIIIISDTVYLSLSHPHLCLPLFTPHLSPLSLSLSSYLSLSLLYLYLSMMMIVFKYRFYRRIQARIPRYYFCLSFSSYRYTLSMINKY